jgi:ABC-type sulfate/molybdate transport systems ATPase subunit
LEATRVSIAVDIRLQAGAFALDAAFTTDAGTTAILGASGAGKTLLLRAIAGLHTPQGGDITLSGSSLFNSAQRTNMPARKRRVGYLFQDYALFPHLTVAQNIAFGVGKGDNRDAVARMVDLLRLHGLEDRTPPRLSGGERQRVALGRALAPHPDLLLLDEPFSALDAPTRETLVEEFFALREAIDVPTILVTHDIGEAYALAEHLVVMGNGRVLQSGPKDEVFYHPGTPDVARLVGVQNVFASQRDGRDVIVGVRATDLFVSSAGTANATLRQTIDRGVQLVGQFATDAGDQLVAVLDRTQGAEYAVGTRWHVEAREGTELVWSASPSTKLAS